MNCLFQILSSVNNQVYFLRIVLYETFLAHMSPKEKFSDGTTSISVRHISYRHYLQIKRVSRANKLLFHSIHTINLFFKQKKANKKNYIYHWRKKALTERNLWLSSGCNTRHVNWKATLSHTSPAEFWQAKKTGITGRTKQEPGSQEVNSLQSSIKCGCIDHD